MGPKLPAWNLTADDFVFLIKEEVPGVTTHLSAYHRLRQMFVDLKRATAAIETLQAENYQLRATIEELENKKFEEMDSNDGEV